MSLIFLFVSTVFAFSYEQINQFVLYSENAVLNTQGKYTCSYQFEPIGSEQLGVKLIGYGDSRTESRDQLIINCIQSRCNNLSTLVFDIGLPEIDKLTSEEKLQFFEAHGYSKDDLQTFEENSSKKDLKFSCKNSNFNSRLIIYSLCTGIPSC